MSDVGRFVQVIGDTPVFGSGRRIKLSLEKEHPTHMTVLMMEEQPDVVHDRMRPVASLVTTIPIDVWRAMVKESDEDGLGLLKPMPPDSGYALPARAGLVITLQKVEAWHVLLQWYWRRFCVPREALGDPNLGLRGLWEKYCEDNPEGLTYRHHRLSRMIYANERPVGYVSVNREWDLGIYIGPSRYRGLGIGSHVVEKACHYARSYGAKVVTIGTNRPGWWVRRGFTTIGPETLDKGVYRTPMEKRL